MVENDTHRVQKLDSDGNFLASWGGEGTSDGKLTYPRDIAVDAANGTAYVVDSNNDRIEKFDTGGKFVSAWGWGVSDGANAFQVCTSGCREGATGDGPGQMTYPTGIAIDGANVYVADYSNKRIEKFDLAGAFVGQWAIPGGQQPEQLTVAAGKVYVTTRENAVWRFDQNGAPDNSWDGDGAAGSSGSGAGQFSFPRGVAVDGTGVYVADSKNNRVEKFDLNGAFESSWGRPATETARSTSPGEFWRPAAPSGSRTPTTTGFRSSARPGRTSSRSGSRSVSATSTSPLTSRRPPPARRT